MIMISLIRSLCVLVFLALVLLTLSGSALVLAVAPPLSDRGPDGPTTWNTNLIRQSTSDTLELRAGPGNDHPIVASVSAADLQIVALGPAYRKEGTLWVEVRVMDSTLQGWTSRATLAPMGTN
jgi:hypothetical protein